MADNTFPNLTAALEQYGAAFRNLYQDKLILADAIATGELLNSVNYRVTQDGTTYEVSLSLAKYWKYIEEGRRPGLPGSKMPPPSAILKWIMAKPVVPRPSDKGRVPKPEQLAWAIAKRIQVKGIPAKPLLFETAQEINDHYRPIIAAAFAADTMAMLRLSAIGSPLRGK